MYHPDRVAADLARVLASPAGKLYPAGVEALPVDTCRSFTRQLAYAWDPTRGQPTRPLTAEESAFIANERLLTKLDYAYWAERYATIIHPAKGVSPMYPLWESQRLILEALGEQQQLRWERQHPDGLVCNILKGRQLGASTLCQSILAHRATTQSYTKGMIGSDVPENSGSTGLFGMFELTVEHLPWWLKPGERFHQKDQHIVFSNHSSIVVESGKSMKGAKQDDGGQKGQLGRSKSQPLDEPVLTPGGWVPMGNLRVGDYVIGRNGQPTRIKGVYPQGVEDVYRVTFSDGSSTRCSGDHLWTIQTVHMKWASAGQRWRTQPLRELARTLRLNGAHGKRGGRRYFIPLMEPAQLDTQGALPLPAYGLGLLLGDGGLTQAVRFSTVDAELRDALARLLPPELRLQPLKGCDYQISARRGQRNAWTTALRALGLLGKRSTAKHIPRQYLHAGVADRLALLQGLLDTDGWATVDGRVFFGTSSEQLADDVCELVQLLGGTAAAHSYQASNGRPYWRLEIVLPPQFVPFRLSRKCQRLKPRQRTHPVRGMDRVEYAGVAETQCIAVEAPDQLYVTRGGIVTHNTYSVVHLSELSTWENPQTIDDALSPAVAQTPRTFWAKESTAKGRHNWWHQEWLATERGLGRSFNIFIPWYAERSKYWLPVPEGWEPPGYCLEYAERVSRHAPRWMRRSFSLSKEQLYWYYANREAAQEKDALYKFLEEYPAEPEEAFQYSGRGIFPPAVIDQLRNQTRAPRALYRVQPSVLIAEIRDELYATQQVERALKTPEAEVTQNA